MSDNTIGKIAENRIRKWLDRPDDGYSFDRIPDQMTGFFNSKNICDFICFKSPHMWYIESKATWEDRFDFVNITDTQRKGLLDKSKIKSVHGVIILLFATYQKAFILDINQIQKLIDGGIKSLNIKKIDKWNIPYAEIQTVENNRAIYPTYLGDLEDYIEKIYGGESN